MCIHVHIVSSTRQSIGIHVGQRSCLVAVQPFVIRRYVPLPCLIQRIILSVSCLRTVTPLVIIRIRVCAGQAAPGLRPPRPAALAALAFGDRTDGGARSLTTAMALPYAAGKMLWPAWGPSASAHAFRSRAAAVVSHPQPPAPTAAFLAMSDATSRDGTKRPAGRSNSWPVATASPASLERLPSCPLVPCSRHPRPRHLGMASLQSLPSGARLR